MTNKLTSDYNNYKNIKNIFNNGFFKNEMEMNIRHILFDRPQKCSFVLSEKHTDCFTDGKTIVIGLLEEFKDLSTSEIFVMIKALVGHEASHIRWSNFNDLKKFHSEILKRGYNSDFAISLANIMEDGRIERLLCSDLPGYKKYIKYLNLSLIYKDGNISNSDYLSNLFNTILFISKLEVYPLNFFDIFNKQEQDFVNNIVKPKVLECVRSSSSRKLFDLTLELLDYISNNFYDLKTDGISKELGVILSKNLDPGYSTYEGSISEDDITSYKIDYWRDGENIRPDIENMLRMDLNASEMLSKLLNEVSEDFNKIIEINNLQKIEDVFQNQSDDFFTSIDLENINNAYSENLKEPNFEYEKVNAPYTTYPSELALPIRLLENQFKKLLLNDDSLFKNQRRGRLNPSSLWKLDTVYDRNVFIKKNNVENSNYSVYILIDLSGSMNSKLKYNEAINTAIKIEGSLINLNGVKVKTVGFDYYNGTRMRVFKDFNEKKSRTAHALIKNYSGGCNRDGFAIRVALEDLRKNGSKNNLLVVISDGRPFWDNQSTEQAMKDVKEVVHMGRRDTTIMSVLINEGEVYKHIKDCFYYMYEDKGTIMVDINSKSEELTNTIVLYLKQLFKKR